MSDDRSLMIEALQTHVIPELRRRGFTGSFPHFRRPLDGAIHLLTFQFDKRGGGFVVEIATCPPDGVTVAGEHVPPEKVTAHSVTRRLRLGATGEGQDHWFRYDGLLRRFDRGRFVKLAEQVSSCIQNQAEPWWSR